MKKVDVYLSCSMKDGRGGWCAVLSYGQVTLPLSGVKPTYTATEMLLDGAIQALGKLKEMCAVTIYCRTPNTVKWLIVAHQ